MVQYNVIHLDGAVGMGSSSRCTLQCSTGLFHPYSTVGQQIIIADIVSEILMHPQG